VNIIFIVLIDYTKPLNHSKFLFIYSLLEMGLLQFWYHS